MDDLGLLQFTALEFPGHGKGKGESWQSQMDTLSQRDRMIRETNAASAGEERAAQKENSLDPQRGALRVRKLPEARVRTTGRLEGMVLTQSQEQCLFPPARLEDGLVDRILGSTQKGLVSLVGNSYQPQTEHYSQFI